MELFYQNMLQQIRNHPILENAIISFTKYIYL